MGKNIKNGRRYLILGQNSNIFSHFYYSPPDKKFEKLSLI